MSFYSDIGKEESFDRKYLAIFLIALGINN